MANVFRQITLTEQGSNSGPFYDAYYSVDGISYTICVDGNAIFLNGIGSVVIVTVPDTANYLKLVNLSAGCSNNDIIQEFNPPTTTTTSTTTAGPTTTTTTFSSNPCICTEVVVTSAPADVATFNCYGVNENYVYFNPGTYYLCAATIGGLLQVEFISGAGTISQFGNCKTGACPPITTTTTTTIYPGVCRTYFVYEVLCDGGVARYGYTDCATGEAREVTVSSCGSQTICSRTAPTLISGNNGTNSYNTGGVCNATTTTTTIALTTTTTTLPCPAPKEYNIIYAGNFYWKDCNGIDRYNYFNAGDVICICNSVDLPVSFDGGSGTLAGGGCECPSPTTTTTAGPTTTTTAGPTTTTTTTAGPTILDWQYIHERGATGTMVIYVNGIPVETRSSDSSDTWPLSLGDVINVQLSAGACSGGNPAANAYTLGIINDAACGTGSTSLTTGGYTVVSGDIGTTLLLSVYSTCDSGCA